MGSIKIGTHFRELGSMEATAGHIYLGYNYSRKRVQNPVYSSPSVFQRHSLHYCKTGAGTFAVTRAAISSGQRGHRTYSPPRERERETGYYSRYQKDGGMCLILDLQGLNHSVRMLKLLTMKMIVSQIPYCNWFVTIDLKEFSHFTNIITQEGEGCYCLWGWTSPHTFTWFYSLDVYVTPGSHVLESTSQAHVWETFAYLWAHTLHNHDGSRHSQCGGMGILIPKALSYIECSFWKGTSQVTWL